MKIRVFTFLALIAFLSVSVGCSKFLEEYPEYELVGEQAIVDEQSAFMALNGVYGYLQMAPTRAYGATGGTMPYNIMVYSALRAGLITGGSGTIEIQQPGLWIDPGVAALGDYYGECYKIINAANNVLFYTDKLPEDKIDEASRIRITAQARFLRGLSHYWLLRAYGYHWDVTSPYGIVLRDTPSTYANQIKARSTVEQSYQLIIEDLQYCIDHGDEVVSSVFKASSNVARAFLMEVLLQRQAQEDSGRIVSLANDIIQSNAYQLEPTFADAFSLEKPFTQCKELMFSRPIDQAGIPDMISGVGGGTYSMFNRGMRNNSFIMTDAGAGMYSQLVLSDERYPHTWAIMSAIVGNPPRDVEGETLLKAWRRDGQLPSYLMRLPQVYLMKAEALLNQGAPVDQVIDIINIFRARSENDLLTEAEISGNRDLLREKLVEEYVLELGLENGCEYFAMVRNRGLDGHRILRKFNYNYVDDMQLAYPIPHDESARDDGAVVQNPLFGN